MAAAFKGQSGHPSAIAQEERAVAESARAQCVTDVVRAYAIVAWWSGGGEEGCGPDHRGGDAGPR